MSSRGKVHIDDLEKAKKIAARNKVVGHTFVWLAKALAVVAGLTIIVLFFVWNWVVASVVIGILGGVGLLLWWGYSADWAEQVIRDANIYGVIDE